MKLANLLELLKCSPTDTQLLPILVPGLTLCLWSVRHLEHEGMLWSVKEFAELVYRVTRGWCEF